MTAMVSGSGGLNCHSGSHGGVDGASTTTMKVDSDTISGYTVNSSTYSLYGVSLANSIKSCFPMGSIV